MAAQPSTSLWVHDRLVCDDHQLLPALSLRLVDRHNSASVGEHLCVAVVQMHGSEGSLAGARRRFWAKERRRLGRGHDGTIADSAKVNTWAELGLQRNAQRRIRAQMAWWGLNRIYPTRLRACQIPMLSDLVPYVLASGCSS